MPPEGFPSDDDVQKVYDANRASLVVPRQYQLSQIFIAAAKDADKATDDKARKKLEDIQKKLKAPGADFAAIGSAESDTPGSSDLGWLPESQIVPEIRAQVAGLAKGTISEPVRLDDGWHILKLIDTKASYTRPLSEVHDQLVQQMRAERATAIRRGYIAELLKQHPPAINELALSKCLAINPRPRGKRCDVDYSADAAPLLGAEHLNGVLDACSYRGVAVQTLWRPVAGARLHRIAAIRRSGNRACGRRPVPHDPLRTADQRAPASTPSVLPTGGSRCRRSDWLDWTRG